MSNYVKITDYAAKDALLTGNPSKVVSGTEIGADFDAVATAVATKVDSGGALGTPSSGTLTNCTGTAAGLTAGTVTTNANLTGHVTSVGNAAVLGSFTIAQLNTAVSDANVAQAGANSDITSLTGLTTPLSAAQGGTGTTTGIPSFASSAENIAGTVEDKIVDPLGIREAFNATGSAPVYACRAWVNFNGVSAAGTYGRSGTTVTVTLTSHGMTTGQVANMTFAAGTGGTATAGSYAVTVVDANTFTITDTASGTITGSPAATRNLYIRASGNVSSVTDNGSGDWTINFLTAMPDASYAIDGTTDFTTEIMNVGLYSSASQTTTTCRILTRLYATGASDRAVTSFKVHR